MRRPKNLIWVMPAEGLYCGYVTPLEDTEAVFLLSYAKRFFGSYLE
jgi:hypothetical protein